MLKQTLIYQWIRTLWYRGVKIPLAYHWTQQLSIMSSMESLQYIIEKKCSVSRFGDGEFDVINGGGNDFQQPNKKLAELLKKVLTSNDAPNFRVGIPLPIKSIKGLRNPYAFWPYLTVKYKDFFKKVLSSQRIYLNTQFSRFYYEHKNKHQCTEQLALIKQIWEKRDIVIVEGTQTRSGIGNDLYDNAKSVCRILGPAENAFEKYEETLAAIQQHVGRDKLILLCYGMTATVLAYDLAKLGYQAIDLGHVDIEYEWFRMGATERVAIKGKYTNETADGRSNIDECNDTTYQRQILVDVTKESNAL